MKIKKRKNDDENLVGFWEGEKCEYCNGPILEKKIALPRKVGRRYILIKNVPVGVCKECGTKYYAANILKTIESSVRGRRKPVNKVPMFVYSL
mgnify:FL=1